MITLRLFLKIVFPLAGVGRVSTRIIYREDVLNILFLFFQLFPILITTDVIKTSVVNFLRTFYDVYIVR